ncbi:hypothetical protein ILYODFUR_020690 [Ilyodon furcidens]|uniref:Uncharacterized protein n=2 Tax=Goodeidae TaxID=28758 RepID=A0ABV0SYR1_9TELE
MQNCRFGCSVRVRRSVSVCVPARSHQQTSSPTPTHSLQLTGTMATRRSSQPSKRGIQVLCVCDSVCSHVCSGSSVFLCVRHPFPRSKHMCIMLHMLNNCF